MFGENKKLIVFCRLLNLNYFIEILGEFWQKWLKCWTILVCPVIKTKIIKYVGKAYSTGLALPEEQVSLQHNIITLFPHKIWIIYTNRNMYKY